MFRKPKRKAKESLRRQDSDEDDDKGEDHSKQTKELADDDPDSDPAEEETTTVGALLSEARKKTKQSATTKSSTNNSTSIETKSKKVMHSYGVSSAKQISNADLATRTAEHHSKEEIVVDGKAERGADGIFRDQTRNKFAAGPIRAQTNIRVTARFDYQPDICKDYKDTGFCGYGDTCIYLHDRGDTLTGWQLEQQWEEEQKKKKQDQALQAFVDQHSAAAAGGGSSSSGKLESGGGQVTTEDGVPFACYLCRQAFSDPVVTTCQHYFCQACIMQHVRTVSEACPICNKDTSSVFNQPTKLLAKKRRLVGAKASWQEYLEAFTTTTTKEEEK